MVDPHRDKSFYARGSSDQLFGRFISSAGLYGAALLLTRIGWILLLPIYWTRLSPDDYGIIGVALLVQVFLNPVLSLGLHDSVQRFYQEWDQAERPRHIAVLWLTSLAWGGLICVLLTWLGSAFSRYVFAQVPFQPFLQIAIWTAFCTNLGIFPQAIFRIRDQIGRYSLIVSGSFVSQAVITVLLVVVFDAGPEGYLVGMLINAGLWGIYYITFMRKEMAWDFNRRHLTEPLRYGLPTVPVAILDGAASLFDRFFLDKYVSLAQLGIYNISNQFGSAFNIFNHMMKTSWFPFLYRVAAERSDTREILGKFSVYYLVILALPALLVALLSKELLELFGDERFFGVYSLVPLFVLGYYIQSVAAAMGRGLDLAKKTAYWPIVSIVSISASLIGLSILVPRYGVVGAAIALILASFIRVFVQVGLSYYFYPRPLYWGALIKLGLLIMLIFAVAYQVDLPTVPSLAAKMSIIFVGYLLIGWFVAGRDVSVSLVGQTLRFVSRRNR